MAQFTVTYCIVTPDSAEHGDYAETGFVIPGQWTIPISEALANKEDDYTMTLREALDLAQPDEDCGRWFAETTTERCDYSTGAYEQRAIHPPHNITPSSYNRLRRLILNSYR